jgi:transposase
MSLDDLVKLTDENIRWMVKRVSSANFTVKQASRTYRITERRVQQLTKMYRDTGEIPKLNPNRRQKTHLSDEQEVIIAKARGETRLGAKLLFYELKRRGYGIPHNRFICISEKLTEQRLIPRNRRKESSADMKGNIQEF